MASTPNNKPVHNGPTVNILFANKHIPVCEYTPDSSCSKTENALKEKHFHSVKEVKAKTELLKRVAHDELKLYFEKWKTSIKGQIDRGDEYGGADKMLSIKKDG